MTETDPEKTRKWEVCGLLVGAVPISLCPSALTQEREHKRQMKKMNPRMKQMKVRVG